MGFWASFWGGLLAMGLVAFAILSLVVGIGGASEIRALFERIEEQHEEQHEEESP